MVREGVRCEYGKCFSALQRAEIAEIRTADRVSFARTRCFSALQRAEIAEIREVGGAQLLIYRFQCSSTSRNC